MSMNTDIKKYDGTLLHDRFAYKYFGSKVIPIGNLLAFRGPMEVLADGMIDQEDVDRGDFIWSDDAINFLWEIPILSNPFGAVAYQRLFNTEIGKILSTHLALPVEMEGDDIMVKDNFTNKGIAQTSGKASVSITYVKNGVALGHTGINIKAGTKAPAFAYSTNLSDHKVTMFVNDVQKMFYALNDDIFIATSKIIIK
jgi:hypothetical protein